MTDEPTRPFSDFLRETARGKSHEELSAGLQQLVHRVQETGKPGTISYTLKIEPMKGHNAALTASDEIKLRLPEHDRPASLFFADRAGNLRRDDPNQESLFESLREVPPPADVRETPPQRDAR